MPNAFVRSSHIFVQTLCILRLRNKRRTNDQQNTRQLSLSWYYAILVSFSLSISLFSVEFFFHRIFITTHITCDRFEYAATKAELHRMLHSRNKLNRYETWCMQSKKNKTKLRSPNKFNKTIILYIFCCCFFYVCIVKSSLFFVTCIEWHKLSIGYVLDIVAVQVVLDPLKTTKQTIPRW